MIKKIASIILLFICLTAYSAPSNAADKSAATVSPLAPSLNILKEEILSYFALVSGNISSITGQSVSIDKGTSASIKRGMRISAFKEGASFIHPVTKEPMGKMEMTVGNIEITSVDAASSNGTIISGKFDDFQGAKIKVPARKIRLLFYQGNLDWYLGDAYYHALLDSGRFELIDTGLQTATTADIIAEAKAKSAEVAVVLSSEELKNSIEVTQKLYWVSDGKQFSDTKTSVHVAAVKQLKFSAGMFAPREGEALLTYRLPFSARRLAVGDFDGSGNSSIVLASGDHVAIYKPDMDLKLLWEVPVPGADEVLWMDTLDVKKNGRDMLLITTMRNQTVRKGDTFESAVGDTNSYIFELQGDTFKLVWKAENTFIRKVENSIVSQGFSRADGFDGKMYQIAYSDGRFVKGEEFRMPKGIAIFDFQYVYAPDGKRAFFAWEDNGFLSLYNDKGVRIWASKEDFGGFADSYKKESQIIMIEKGNWYIKDRLAANNAEVLAPKRKSMFSFARSLGYSGSELRSFWWNGITVEERGFLEELSGNILDYTIVGDRLLVLIKPYLLGQAKSLLKGQNVTGIRLYIFSTKGR
ncbi:MAG TPA: hypothetical protein VMB78_04910 [Dissulfurispiraceae bacterium]|nr:hypothetical protein [Dissulfurispiraceae bacterium]